MGHALHIRTVQMWHAVREATGGQLEVAVVPNNQQGADPSALAQLRSCAIQFFTASGGLIGGVVPVAQIENVGFAFCDAGAALTAMDGELGAYLRSEIAARGLVGVNRMWDNGMRHITTSTKPVREATDVAGMKLHTPPGALWVDLLRTLGAAPAPNAGSEFYTALQTRVVDGQENAPAAIEARFAARQRRDVALPNHSLATSSSAVAWRSTRPTAPRLAPASRRSTPSGEASSAPVRGRCSKHRPASSSELPPRRQLR